MDAGPGVVLRRFLVSSKSEPQGARVLPARSNRPSYRARTKTWAKTLSQNGLSQNGLSQNGYGDDDDADDDDDARGTEAKGHALVSSGL